MEERGYQQDSRTGKWRRQVPPTRALTVRDLGDGFEEHAIEAVVKPRRGPSWSGILKKRNAKRKAR